MVQETEESKKVAKLGGKKYIAVFRRISEIEANNQRPKLIQNLLKEWLIWIS